MELERKFTGGPVALGDHAVISGYASLFDRADSGGDVVARGAYRAALARAEGRVRMLWQHDPARPIGVWEEIREDERGLWVKGRLLQDVQLGREAAALLQAGAIDGLSIGYRTKRATAMPTGRRLEEIDLWEVSLVTFPMQAAARVAAKSGHGPEGGAGGAAPLLQLAGAFRAARSAMEALA